MDFNGVQEDILNIVLPAHLITIFLIKGINYALNSYFTANSVSLPLMDFFTGLVYLLPWTIAIYFVAKLALEDRTKWKWIGSGILVEFFSMLFSAALTRFRFGLPNMEVLSFSFVILSSLGITLTKYALIFGLVTQYLSIYRDQ